MGGTSTDVALLQGGQCKLTSEKAMVHGYPLKAPMGWISTRSARAAALLLMSIPVAC